jgi:K+-transporting ATPase ATPase C chain
MKSFVITLRVAAVTFLLTGILYPLGITFVAQVFFPETANGSLLQDESGRVVGSRLIGQRFHQAGYFHPRPSAASYDGLASGGSNLGTTSALLRQRVTLEIARLRAINPEASDSPPVELVTTSASGLDPHLSRAAARWQVPRVARARGVSPARVQGVLEEWFSGRDLGILGEPTVNVLELNLMLDRRFGKANIPH